MDSYLAEIFEYQERVFKKSVVKDCLDFNEKCVEQTGFDFLEINSREYRIQKYFEKRLEHYLRSCINEVLRTILEVRGVGVHKSELPSALSHRQSFYTNQEYEEITGYEFIADYKDSTVMYRYTDVSADCVEALLSDFEDQLVVINWSNLVKDEHEKNSVISNGKEIRHCSLSTFFSERIGFEEYQALISFLTNLVGEFQEFIGVKSVPKLSPFSLGQFRFDVERSFVEHIKIVRNYIKADLKTAEMHIDGIHGINYGYKVIYEENKKDYGKVEENSKRLLYERTILNSFDENKLYRYLLGCSDLAKSLITSEYLYKQYDCDDCFDYTAVVSGYLKSVEQLLFYIATFAKNKGYKIKSNGKRKKDGKYPKSEKDGKVFKIKFSDENDGCFDTTIGSLIHFFDDNKEELLLVDEKYKETIIKCLDCYRLECRNDSFHLDNNYTWSKVELIRWNTFTIYLMLLTCVKLGDSDMVTKRAFRVINDDRLERLYNIISTGKGKLFEFTFMGENGLLEPIIVKHITEESSYPSYDKYGRIKSAFLTFEEITTAEKVVIVRKNVPIEMSYYTAEGEKIKIE